MSFQVRTSRGCAATNWVRFEVGQEQIDDAPKQRSPRTAYFPTNSVYTDSDPVRIESPPANAGLDRVNDGLIRPILLRGASYCVPSEKREHEAVPGSVL